MIGFSIIIPHFGIPDLLVRCLQSIPVREDIQVIVVDDGTQGWEHIVTSTPELHREFLEVYSTSKHGSAGRARNIGLEHAKGTWLMFIDADDLFSPCLYDELADMRNSESDVVFFRSMAVLNDNLTEHSNRNYAFDRYFDGYFIERDESYLRYCFAPIWGKVIRRSLVVNNNIRFDETRYSNDVYFSFLVGRCAKSIAVSPQVIYILTDRRESLAYALYGHQKMSIEQCRERFYVAFKIRRCFDKLGILATNNDYAMYLSKIKEYHKAYYIVVILRMLVEHPKYALREISGFLGRKLKLNRK